MFSETRVGLYYVHTVANRPSGLVAKNVTKKCHKKCHLFVIWSKPVYLQSSAKFI